MRGHEVSPTSLELEITETTLMENPERTIKLLDQLYSLGLHLAIDDFGAAVAALEDPDPAELKRRDEVLRSR